MYSNKGSAQGLTCICMIPVCTSMCRCKVLLYHLKNRNADSLAQTGRELALQGSFAANSWQNSRDGLTDFRDIPYDLIRY